MWNFIVKALKEALKEKVTEMTKEEVKEWLDKIGVKVEEVTDELIAKVEAQKALLDAETRRKTRLFWGPVGLLIGAGERQKFCVHGIIGARQTGASNEHEHQTQFS